MHETPRAGARDGPPRPPSRTWASAADGREWTLTLAPATFHDGAPVTARTPCAACGGSCARVGRRGPLARPWKAGTSRRRGTDALPGLTAPDDARVVLRFRRGRPCPLAPLASPAAAIVERAGAGAGPFVPGRAPSARA